MLFSFPTLKTIKSKQETCVPSEHVDVLLVIGLNVLNVIISELECLLLHQHFHGFDNEWELCLSQSMWIKSNGNRPNKQNSHYTNSCIHTYIHLYMPAWYMKVWMYECKYIYYTTFTLTLTFYWSNKFGCLLLSD